MGNKTDPNLNTFIAESIVKESLHACHKLWRNNQLHNKLLQNPNSLS